MSTESPSCDVVVTTHHRPDLLEECLHLLSGQTLAHQVIVVDDGGDERTTSLVRDRYPGARLLRLEPSREFAAAASAGMRAGDGAIVVLLDNDVRPEPSYLEALVGPLRSDPSVGMAASLLLRPDGLIDSFGLEVDRTLAVFPRLWGCPPRADLLAGRDGLLGPAGAGGAYRREALEQAGGLDERLVSYNEDTDIALRLRATGWTCAAAPAARGVHLGSATRGRRSSWQLYRLGFSRAFLLRKYGVLREPWRATRALGSEASSILWQLVFARDASGLRGRVAGWRAARPEQPLPRELLNDSITFREAIARRRAFHG